MALPGLNPGVSAPAAADGTDLQGVAEPRQAPKMVFLVLARLFLFQQLAQLSEAPSDAIAYEVLGRRAPFPEPLM